MFPFAILIIKLYGWWEARLFYLWMTLTLTASSILLTAWIIHFYRIIILGIWCLVVLYLACAYEYSFLDLNSNTGYRCFKLNPCLRAFVYANSNSHCFTVQQSQRRRDPPPPPPLNNNKSQQHSPQINAHQSNNNRKFSSSTPMLHIQFGSSVAQCWVAFDYECVELWLFVFIAILMFFC